MIKEDPKHIAQEIVDRIFSELQNYVETAEKSVDPEELDRIERRREQLMQQLRIVLTGRTAEKSAAVRET